LNSKINLATHNTKPGRYTEACIYLK
jgi:hypothetical protein